MPENNESKIAEIMIDVDSVNVSRERYDELIKGEAFLNIIKKMRQKKVASYQIEELLDCLIEKKGENEDAE